MRGPDEQRSHEEFTASPERLVPESHPLRAIKQMADMALSEMSPIFDAIYSFAGRPSIPPERLLRAQLIQILYSVRSERLLVEQLQYNMLFRWFVGMSGTESVWDASTYAKNRDRFLGGDVAAAFFTKVLDQAQQAGLTSDEHFSVDGTLVEAWASFKSLKPKDGLPTTSRLKVRRRRTTRSISRDRSARMTPTSRRPIPRPASTRRARGRATKWPSSATS